MAELTSVIAVLNGLKTATEIAKTLKDVDVSIEKAELKLQMAELISAIADAKISAAEVQELILQKDKEIEELKKSLQKKAELVRYLDAYYEQNEKGDPTGVPYCSHCWEAFWKLIHLHRYGTQNVCGSCKLTFSGRTTPRNPELRTEKN